MSETFQETHGTAWTLMGVRVTCPLGEIPEPPPDTLDFSGRILDGSTCSADLVGASFTICFGPRWERAKDVPLPVADPAPLTIPLGGPPREVCQWFYRPAKIRALPTLCDLLPGNARVVLAMGDRHPRTAEAPVEEANAKLCEMLTEALEDLGPQPPAGEWGHNGYGNRIHECLWTSVVSVDLGRGFTLEWGDYDNEGGADLDPTRVNLEWENLKFNEWEARESGEDWMNLPECLRYASEIVENIQAGARAQEAEREAYCVAHGIPFTPNERVA